jgi:nitrogen fixation protein NifQ
MADSAAGRVTADREQWYASLMAHSVGQGNDHALACMTASWLTGAGALPQGWGLSGDDFTTLMAFHFPGWDSASATGPATPVDATRDDERGELVKLMKAHRAGWSPSEIWVAAIVAEACMANDHLWQDLGLWCRADLSDLMERNFPTLAAKNVANMKWKKFLYKQLCVAEGIYTCRAPSCAVCVDYQVCFGPEE